MPTEDGAGCVCRPCLPWWCRSWVAVAVTAEMTYPVSADQLAVVEAAGRCATQGGLIGDCAIASFKEIAAGLIPALGARRCSRVVWTSSVRGVRARSSGTMRSGCRLWDQVDEHGGVVSGTRTGPVSRRDQGLHGRRGRAGTGRDAVPGPSTSRGDADAERLDAVARRGSRGGGRRLRRGAGVVIERRTGGRRGDSRRPPDCRPGLGWRGDAPRIVRRAGDGGGR